MRWHSAPTARSTSSRTERSGTRRRRPPRSSTPIRGDETANGPFDLVVFGNESADAGNFQIGIRVAYALGRPVATGLKGVGVDGETVRCEQEVAGGRDVYVLPLPAVVTVLEGLNLPRYPSVPAKLRAQRKPVDASSPARPELEAREGPTRRSRGTGQGGRDPRPRARGGTRRRRGAAADRRRMTVLVVVERTPDGIHDLSLQAIAFARAYAADEPVDALVVGDSDGLEGVLGEHGVSTVHVAEHEAFSSLRPGRRRARGARRHGSHRDVRGRRRRERARQRGARPRRGDRRPAVRGELPRGDRGRSRPRDARALGRQPPRRGDGSTGRPRS